MTGVQHELELLLKARYPLVLLETYEQERAEAPVRAAARALELPSYSWTRTKGLREGTQLAPSPETLLPPTALAEVERLVCPGVYLFHGLGADLARRGVAEGRGDHNGGRGRRSPALRLLSTRLLLPLPSAAEHRELIAEVYRDVTRRAYTEVNLTETGLKGLARGFEGLVIAGLYSAFAAGAELGTALLLREAGLIRPLSRLLPDKVAALRAWAHGRTRADHQIATPLAPSRRRRSQTLKRS